MQTLLLYAAVVLIWGTTWAAIPYQLDVVPVPVSIGYRFILAAAVLYAFALMSGRRLAIPLRNVPHVLLQGLLLFCINYLFVYFGTAYITSGLVAVVFSLIVLFNTVFGRLFFGTPLDASLLVAGAVGAAGIALLFLPEFGDAASDGRIYLGIALVAAGTVSASLGNMAAVANLGRGLPVVAVNAHGMAAGGLLSLALAAGLSMPMRFSFDTGYIVSLVYLAIVGSAIAFGCYIALIERIGASRAAYSSVLFPVVALLTSTLIEDYRWSFAAGIGILLTLFGNWLTLSRRNEQHREKEE